MQRAGAAPDLEAAGQFAIRPKPAVDAGMHGKADGIEAGQQLGLRPVGDFIDQLNFGDRQVSGFTQMQ